MPLRKPPSFRSQLLGKLLRECREKAGYKLSEAGEYIQRDQSTMSRLESGHQPVRVPDMQALLRLYDVTDEAVWAGMEQLSRDVFRKDWWDEFADALSSWLVDFPWLEERSRTIKSYDAMVPCGLLQTRDYAEALIRAVDPDDEAWIERTLEFRMRRQRILDQERPPKLSVLLDESALYRPVGGARVTHAQLDYLLESSELANIDIRVLPFMAGAHAGLTGSFQIYEMPDLLTDLAWTDALAGTLYVESHQVARYRRAYDELRKHALSQEQSMQVILEAARNIGR